MTSRMVTWQTMQRRLAEAAAAETIGYPMAGVPPQPNWRFASGPGSWLSRTRRGVIRRYHTGG
jgi:hypothetical protein